MSVFVDIGPLRRYPQFRRLWMGYIVTLMGSQLTTVAVAYQVYTITKNNLDVGLVSLVQLVPALAGSILGGSVADAIDRRRVLIVCQCAMAISSVGLAMNAAASHPHLWVIYLCAAVTAGFNGADSPTRLAVQANLVPREDFAAANTIRQLLQQVSYIAGPGLAGLLIAVFHLRVVFLVDVATYFVAIAAVASMKPLPPAGGGRKFGLKSIGEGFAYLKGRQVIQGCFVADLNAMVFGIPTALFPALAIHHFHGGSKTLGLLYLGSNIGSFLMAFFSGWTARIRRQGIAVLVAIAIYGLFIIGFGATHILILALALLACSGASDVISAVFRNTIIQTEVPDQLRGRISAINIAAINGGPRLGNTESGIVAQLTSTQVSVISGGIAVVLGVFAMAKFMPKFRDYVVEPVVAEAILSDGSVAVTSATEVEAEESGGAPL
jgi:MFS family permease